MNKLSMIKGITIIGLLSLAAASSLWGLTPREEIAQVEAQRVIAQKALDEILARIDKKLDHDEFLVLEGYQEQAVNAVIAAQIVSISAGNAYAVELREKVEEAGAYATALYWQKFAERAFDCVNIEFEATSCLDSPTEAVKIAIDAAKEARDIAVLFPGNAEIDAAAQLAELFADNARDLKAAQDAGDAAKLKAAQDAADAAKKAAQKPKETQKEKAARIRQRHAA